MNMQNMLAQANRIQREMSKKKEEVDKTIFEGKSEWVTVEVNGKKELLKYTITYEGIIEQDDREMLEDMTKIAINNANAKAEKAMEEAMGTYGSLGGLF